MALYDEAFGLTMLRLWVVGAAVWLGAVLVLLATGRSWVLGGAVVAALALVVVANVANPEAFVVRHNLDRGGDVDVPYLEGLSADAAGALRARGLAPRCDQSGAERWNVSVWAGC